MGFDARRAYVERPPFEVSARELLEAGDLSGWMEPGTDEWRTAWRRLYAATGDAPGRTTDPETGEDWQYLGSTLVPARLDPAGEGYWFHSFRHRHHPKTGEREYARVRASDRWSAIPIRPAGLGR